MIKEIDYPVALNIDIRLSIMPAKRCEDFLQPSASNRLQRQE